MKKISRRMLLFGSGAMLGAWAMSRFLMSKLNSGLKGTRSLLPLGGKGVLNDASGLSEMPIFRHVMIRESSGDALVRILRDEILEARSEGRPVNIGAARHSMGGQAIPRNGHALSFVSSRIEIDQQKGIYRVYAGTRWHQVIAALDPLGFGPKVMQSNNDFGVAATFCVNAHGWPVVHGPMGATVLGFDIVLPNGELIHCSRNENTDLFALTMGGYGLTGAICSMDIEMVQNLRLEPTFEEIPAKQFGMGLLEALQKSDVNMAYGRLNVDRTQFLEEALMVTYRPAPNQEALPAADEPGLFSEVERYVFRSQLSNEYWKRTRWWIETGIGSKINGALVTRNSLINKPVAILRDHHSRRTDILHEYFIDPERFVDFITICQEFIPSSYQELLNVTLRFVDTDTENWLNYAPTPRISAVMLFSQEMTERAEADMKRMTQSLIDRVIEIGGTYYLPYRPHAKIDQFTSSYPKATLFAKAKRELDPQLIFRNNFWDGYLGKL